MTKKSLFTFLAIAFGIFCIVADQSALLLALPSISKFFGSDLPTTQWVLVSFVLAISISLLPMGRLSDLIGHKRVYVIGFLLLSVTTLAAGFAPSILWLILASFVRGVGSGMTQGTSMALLLSIFTRREGGKALGFYISVVGIGSAIGPLIAGVLLSFYSWRILFLMLSGLGFVAMAAAIILVESSQVKSIKVSEFRFDWLGAILFTVGLAAFLQGMTWSPSVGYSDPKMMLVFGVSIVSILGFIFWELNTKDPMMDLRLFKQPLFSSGIGAAFLCFIGTSSVYFFLPFYLQIVLGYSPYQIGFFSASGAISMAVVGTFSGQLSDRYGPKKFAAAGLLIMAIGIFLLSTLTMNSSWVLPITGVIVTSFGMGTFYGPNNKAILSTIPQDFHGVVSGFIHLVRNSASVTSIAVGILIVTTFMASMGFAPTLSDLSSETEYSVLQSFVKGMRFGLICFGFALLAGFATSLSGGKFKETEG